MALPRFFIPPGSWSRRSFSLNGDEARHCAGVLRKAAGDEVAVFNGAGSWARARIVSANPRHVELACEATFEEAPPAVSISLLQAIPKGANMDFIIEKAVELGVNEIIPVFTERTVVKLDVKDAAKKRDKWQRLALEACKQCGQNWLPQIHTPQPFDAVWSQLPAHDLRLIAAIQDDARPLKAILSSPLTSHLSPLTTALIAIGPEGDFTPAEYALARAHGCLPLSLGPIILRVETAAMFCLSVLAHELRPVVPAALPPAD